MQRFFPALVLALCLALAQSALAGQASEAPGSSALAVGAKFPDLALKAKLAHPQAAYLGLASDKLTRLSAVKAPLILVEIFSMYCPHCQREAPVMNELYSLIAERGLADQIKIVGIGVGNSDAEVEIFRAKFEPAFPLVADPDFVVHSAVGRVGTPHFYLVAKDAKSGAMTVKFSRLGRMDSPGAFLDELTAAAKVGSGDAK